MYSKNINNQFGLNLGCLGLHHVWLTQFGTLLTLIRQSVWLKDHNYAINDLVRLIGQRSNLVMHRFAWLTHRYGWMDVWMDGWILTITWNMFSTTSLKPVAQWVLDTMNTAYTILEFPHLKHTKIVNCVDFVSLMSVFPVKEHI